ncbi:MAG: GAF domain-containing protein [Comamonadaceae bacterium]|nr:MAG: GAF domain-containing protein [Comamonadaceae bacterium]
MPVTLDNCASEPIHIPGHTQRHGALFSFDPSGRLAYRSANAATCMGVNIPALGDYLSAADFPDCNGLHELIARVMAAPADEPIPHAGEVGGALGPLFVIAHRTVAGLTCEFEDALGTAPAAADLQFMVYRAIERLKRQKAVDGLLAVAVDELRRITGFDRVMAYRFRHDDSGDVVAESAQAELEPFVGRRYPAGDIPAQARRLYIINTLRLIADVGAAPVVVEAFAANGAGPGSAAPLDMSHGVLRSVSPVHIEYLTNMGVAASMSVSIVIGGKLWGMLACHHMQPRRVAYTVRMACDMLAQILAANVQGLLAQVFATRADAAASLRLRVVEQVLHADDVMASLWAECAALCEGFGAQAAVLADGAQLRVSGDISQGTAAALVQWLDSTPPRPGVLVHTHSLETLPPALAAELGIWCGVLAMPFGSDSPSWVVLLRKEQIETISWGGHPEKDYPVGPLGARLTPRGSFDLWRQTVRGQSIPWDASDLESGQKLLNELLRADAAHMAETSRARAQLMAMLGHDLRDPIQSIHNTAALMQLDGSDRRHADRLQSSSSRMERLVTQVMDLSLMQRGALEFERIEVDLVPIIRRLLAESRAAHPRLDILPVLPARLLAWADADRLAQVVINLLGNASHHGDASEPVLVRLSQDGGEAVLEVSNAGAPIPQALAASLFMPFKTSATRSPTNRNGLGLGLYIAQQVMAGHGGSLVYGYDNPYVVFTARFPLRAVPADPVRPRSS